MSTKRNRNASCSFCRKNYRDVGPLVEGPGDVYICGECIELCDSIIDQEKRRRRVSVEESRKPNPAALQAKLARIIHGQDEVTRALVEAAVYHYHSRMDRGARSFILLIGPTPSSRLFLARALAHVMEVPFAEADVRALAGSDTRPGLEFLNQLLSAGNFDGEAAQRGVIYVDGIDDRVNQEWLPELWKSVESEASRLPVPIKTDDLLFLCGGEFVGLDEVVVQQGRHPEQLVVREALRGFGMAAELVKRLSVTVRVAPLDEPTLGRMAASLDFSRMPSREEAEESRR